MKVLKFVCSLFFINIFFVSYIYGEAARSIKPQLVKFHSDVEVEYSLKPCQGLQISGRHIATSKDCGEAISERLTKEPVRAVRHNAEALKLEKIQENIEFYSISRLGSHMLLPVLGGKVFDDTIFYEVNSDESINYGFVYFTDEAENIVYEKLQLDRMNPKSDLDNYKVISEVDFPPGSPVFSESGKILCFISNNHLCQIPDFNFATNDQSASSIHKRSSDEACQVKFFQCSNAHFTSCLSNGNGEGSCTNDRTGEKCGVATYQNGFRASYLGQTLYCNNPDGCEVVICPTSCTDNVSSCTCRSTYKLNGQTHKIPCDCIDYTDTSLPCSNEVPEALKYGLGFGIPVAVAFVVVVVVFFVYYHRVNKQARSIPYTVQQ